ncbi:MAG: hypothetical protein FJ119_04965 [Deltaproteobacteria bacterium]|nr:hypothetical protein [Deltaproteobacteria bacterium]
MNVIRAFAVVVSIVCVLQAGPAAAAIVGKVAGEMIEATIKKAARRSGVEMIEAGAQRSARATLERLVKTYGDDVLSVADDAGFELLEAVPRYGDDVIRLAMKASPQARRAFALNVSEMLPLARRVGVEALELEAKTPGLATRAFRVVGDDAGRAIARSVPADDIPRLIKYAEKADRPATKKLLLEAYKKEGKSLFERIPPSLVIATGLSASMLYGTHSATKPLRAVGAAIEKNNDIAETAVRQFSAWGTSAAVFIVVLLLWRFGLMPWHRKAKVKVREDAPAAGAGSAPAR